MERERLTASGVWNQVKSDIVASNDGYVVFDDTVLDKHYSRHIESVRWQYSGNEGYKNEVVPYKNKAINEFMRGESSEKEMINSLSKRAFARKRGKSHPRIGIKNKLNNLPYLKGAGLTSLGALLYKEMFGGAPHR